MSRGKRTFVAISTETLQQRVGNPFTSLLPISGHAIAHASHLWRSFPIMPLMNLTNSQNAFAAAAHLPPGSALVIHDFGWQDYEQLLGALGDHSGLRVSYDSGRLEILSPSFKHDRYSRRLDLLVSAFCEVRGLRCECGGSATWKSPKLGKGVEADACYYVRNADRVIGGDDIGLDTHPPPDIAVEIDLTRSSVRKLSIYAALAVPEVWRYEGQSFVFYTLKEGSYSKIPASLQLPGLTPTMLLAALEDCDTRGSIAAVKAFRRRLRASK